MYNSFQLTGKYIRYYLRACNGKGHGMHSPFLFQFILQVLNNRSRYLPPPSIEALRRQLLHDRCLLQVEDLGAGSRVKSSRQRTVRQLAATAVKPTKYGQLFYRLVKHYQPQTIVELGTSLGLTAAYMAAANSAAQVYTIEGSPAVHELAQRNFQHLRLNNVQALCGNFDAVLPQLLSQLPAVDLAYIDGNHRYEPTLRYFQLLLQKSHNHTILVFDDIHWSREMEQAWEEIQQHPQVQCSVDLFFLGFVFLRREFREKQHFCIRF